MKSVEDKIEVLKAANHLRDSNIYIREDLSVDERTTRNIQIIEMKKPQKMAKELTLGFLMVSWL